ncbi:hypothetical protein D3C79_832330 [compost metagenome]
MQERQASSLVDVGYAVLDVAWEDQYIACLRGEFEVGKVSTVAHLSWITTARVATRVEHHNGVVRIAWIADD